VLKLAPRFVRENPALALFSFLATASSGFGQTFFVGAFGESFRQEFGLTHSGYGLCYSAATLCAAALLLKFGALVDRWPLRRVTSAAVAILAVGCLVLGSASSLLMFVVGLLLIRFGGQAMLPHIAISSAGRYFTAARGKAMALTAAGFPLAEAVLPGLAVLAISSLGWRAPWYASAAFLLLVLLPGFIRLTRDAPDPHIVRQGSADEGVGGTRRDALRDRGFFMLLPASIAVPFTVTAIFFHQAAIADLKNWPDGLFAQAFIGFAGGHLLSLLGAGWMIDRLGAQRSFPLVLIPLIVGLLVVGFGESAFSPILALTLIGLSQGGANATVGAIWPERYGVRHVGAIRSVVQSVMVVSTAVSPILVGFLLDQDLSIVTLATALAVLLFASLVMAWQAGPYRARRADDLGDRQWG
jgi:MFS family permease